MQVQEDGARYDMADVLLDFSAQSSCRAGLHRYGWLAREKISMDADP